MSHELAQHDDEDARISRELSSDANQTGVVGAGGGGLAERTGLLGRDSAGDHSGLLGHFRSPSTAGLVVPSPALPDRTGLAGNLDDPDATNHSGLLGSSGIREREVRQQLQTLSVRMGDDADTAELVAEIADEVKGSAASGGGRRVMHYASDGAMTYESQREADGRKDQEAAMARPLKDLEAAGEGGWDGFPFAGRDPFGWRYGVGAVLCPSSALSVAWDRSKSAWLTLMAASDCASRRRLAASVTSVLCRRERRYAVSGAGTVGGGSTLLSSTGEPLSPGEPREGTA